MLDHYNHGTFKAHNHVCVLHYIKLVGQAGLLEMAKALRWDIQQA